MARPYRGNGKQAHRSRRKAGTKGPPRFPKAVSHAVMVNGYSAEWLGKGFDWVYPAEIVARIGNTSSGSVAEIYGQDGRFLGVGICSSGKVAVRRFRTTPGLLDSAFVESALQSAYSRRRLPDDVSAWRWIHGENDDLPGIRLDVWADVVSLSIDHDSLQFLVPWMVEAIQKLHPVQTIWQNHRPEHDENRGIAGAGQCLFGLAEERDVEVMEYGLRYLVRPERGLDAGLYPDMRDIRKWLEPHWEGRKVLNTFAYTGAFSVAAAANGAMRVDTVDLSSVAVARSRANFERNGIDLTQHGFWVEDTFSAIDRFRRGGDRFDLIVVDPPSFSHGPSGMWSVEKDLSRLVGACLRVLSEGGWILVATNQGSMSPRDFQKHIQTASLKVGRRLRLIHQGTTPHDIPAALGFPESRYLKAWVLEG